MSKRVLIAARGDAGQAWLKALRRRPDARLVAALTLDTSPDGGVLRALEANPGAAAALFSAGPRQSNTLAAALADHAAGALLHPPPSRPPAGEGVQLAHGWLSLAGVGALERLFRSPGIEFVRLQARGVPEGRAASLGPALYHAATVALRLGREVRVDRAVLDGEHRLEVAVTVDGQAWRVDVGARGHGLTLTVRTREGDYQWVVDEVSESLRRPRAEARVMPIRPWAERCVAQLERPLAGASLSDARAARNLIDQVEQRLERRLPPASPGAISTKAGLAGLGLLGQLPEVAPWSAGRDEQPAGQTVVDAMLPLDVLAYQLGLRPAATLEVPPQDADRWAARLEGTVERRDRSSSLEGGRAAPSVELFVARDPAVAWRLHEAHALGLSGRHSEVGGLLGYPACCVQAFDPRFLPDDMAFGALEPPRAAIAARTSIGPGPWPRWLDDTAHSLIPHFPCTYRCERSVAQAAALLDALATEVPARDERLRATPHGPALYFGASHIVRFEGETRDPMTVVYRGVHAPQVPSPTFARLVAAIAQGDTLTLSDNALSVSADGSPLFSLERIDPGLGLLLPFA